MVLQTWERKQTLAADYLVAAKSGTQRKLRPLQTGITLEVWWAQHWWPMTGRVGKGDTRRTDSEHDGFCVRQNRTHQVGNEADDIWFHLQGLLQ